MSMLVPLASPVPIRHGVVDREGWLAIAQDVRASGGRLVALWGSPRPTGKAACAAYAFSFEAGLAWIELPLAEDQAYPDLSGLFPSAVRMQRAARDLDGVQAEDAADQRPWLDHGLWAGQAQPAPYDFVRVDGEGVHEIGVGPVHAGIIEPGHFRFSVVGEKVLRLEQRLGYVHKGIARRFTELAPLDAYRLAGRVSGDSTVAYAWAYCMALEATANGAVPERAQWLRAVLLERERVASHLADLGALGNDAGFAFGLAQFSRLREEWLRLSALLFGHRLMMDRIVPGGVAIDLDAEGCRQLIEQCDALDPVLRRLHTIYDEHAGVQDRFLTTGRVSPQLAARLGLTGLAGRASAQTWDLRCNPSMPPYDQLDVTMATHLNGDVAARVTVRFDEVMESLRLLRELCRRLPAGPLRAELTPGAGGPVGAGWIEGWRGEIFVGLELDESGRTIQRCHCHDPSWQNWPVLEHAIIGNIVPDFPLINKSFNLSYSGHDL
ncbi:MAG: NADH-quinone oxidoreductase subunit C [Burkholderiaceae bacterium]|nr:NADH-quinone oxidoreductase subunit C [Burkholderiaceae bacterium]